MSEAEFARAQMALSLGFHIVFAAIGVAIPLLMVIAEALGIRRGDREYRELARAWSKGTAVLFAVGAVSGTVLSFELGLLFPGFMERSGAVIGLPFALEGAAFFTEAIFLGVYLYGWDRVRPKLHLLAGVIVALSGASSAALVTLANAWMQAPQGFRVDETGAFVDVEPITAMLSPYAVHEIAHLMVAVYAATAFAAGGVHAVALLRDPTSGFHRKALGICLAMAVPASLVQPVIGHFAGQQVAKYQPLKLAAMEGQFVTERGAPLHIGGIVDYETRETTWALKIPGGLSFLATNSFDGEVLGLEEFPEEDWPHPIVHYCFQIMVGVGVLLALLSAWVVVSWVRRRTWPPGRLFLWSVVVAGPLAFVALESGWVVTEVGRQPWVVYGILRTHDAVTPMPGLVVPFTTFTLVYLGLTAATVIVLRRIFRAGPVSGPAEEEAAATPPSGPAEPSAPGEEA